jgi:hypothetical protein
MKDCPFRSQPRQNPSHRQFPDGARVPGAAVCGQRVKPEHAPQPGPRSVPFPHGQELGHHGLSRYPVSQQPGTELGAWTFAGNLRRVRRQTCTSRERVGDHGLSHCRWYTGPILTVPGENTGSTLSAARLICGPCMAVGACNLLDQKPRRATTRYTHSGRYLGSAGPLWRSALETRDHTFGSLGD